jgi:hypothetical protein
MIAEAGLTSTLKTKPTPPSGATKKSLIGSKSKMMSGGPKAPDIIETRTYANVPEEIFQWLSIQLAPTTPVAFLTLLSHRRRTRLTA